MVVSSNTLSEARTHNKKRIVPYFHLLNSFAEFFQEARDRAGSPGSFRCEDVQSQDRQGISLEFQLKFKTSWSTGASARAGEPFAARMFSKATGDTAMPTVNLGTGRPSPDGALKTIPNQKISEFLVLLHSVKPAGNSHRPF